MTAWKRSFRMPARLRHWIAKLRAALFGWSLPHWKHLEHRVSRRARGVSSLLPRRKAQPSFRPGLEGLESRLVPGSVLDVAAAPALLASLAQTNDDLATTSTALLNSSEQSQAANVLSPAPSNTPTVAEAESQWLQMLNALTTDWNKDVQLVSHEVAALANTPLGQAIEQADNQLGQQLGAAHNIFEMLLTDADQMLNNAGKQQGVNNPQATPPANNVIEVSKMAGSGGSVGGVSTPNASGGGSSAPGSGGSANLHLPSQTQLQQLTTGSNGNSPTVPATPAPGGAGQQSQPNTPQNPLTPGGDPPLPFTEGQSSTCVVATFTDADGNTDASQYSASIDWGNGQNTSGTIVYSGGQFQVSGSMSYADEGSYPINVTIEDTDGNQTMATASAAVSDATLTPGTPYPISATVGQMFNGSVASFTDANSTAPASDFMASIDWGDGQTSSGTVTAEGNGQFLVSGSNTYAADSVYPVQVTIADIGGSETIVSTSATVTGGSLSATNGGTLSYVEGAASSPVPVATFTDTDGNTDPSQYSASIDWGNGQTTPASMILYNGGQFQVFGSMTYADEGSYAINVTITDTDGQQTTATATAAVSDAGLPPGMSIPITATVGQVFNGPVVSFSDLNTNAPATDFTASIDWGAGQTSAGLVTAQGAGQFTVSGSNTYATAGNYTVNATISDIGGSQTTVSTSATVLGGLLSASGDGMLPFVEGAASTQLPVATFTDADGNTDPTQYSASIDWGNGQITPGTVQYDANSGQFQVTGSMTYADEGSYAINVTITDTDGQQTMATANATVGDAALSPGTANPITATAGQMFNGTVASFTDANSTAPASDFMASIDWGDGQTSSGMVTAEGDGQFTVSGSNTYAAAGNYAVNVTISDIGGSETIVSTNATVTGGTLSATGGGMLPFVEGTASGQVPVATFTDSDGNTDASQYSASIDWGNGQTTPGTIVYSNGQFQVTGSMSYADEGSYAINVTITDTDGQQTMATANATVGDAALSPGTANPITATAGQMFNGQVASFTDANSTAPASDFMASITWGDGQTSSGTVTAEGAGQFLVSGSNTYATAGSYVVNATISDIGGSETIVSTSATVTGGTLRASGGGTLPFVEGAALYPALVATFTDADGNTDPTQYSANIDWGNGQTTPGTVQYDANSGQFQVYGSITYADEGSYPISVTITDSDGIQTTATATATVSDATLTPGTPNPISATAGQMFNGSVASFTDANTNAPATDFTASIDWGDGQTSAGLVTAEGAGQFLVSGSNTYATAGNYTVNATISDIGGSQTTVSTSAQVANPLSWTNGSPNLTWTQTAVANPSVTTPAAQTNTEGDNVSLQIQASDPNNYPLSYDAVNLPPGLSINSTTGLISGTVQNGAAADFGGSYNPTVIVANNQGGSTQTSFAWTINQIQTAPTLTNPGNQTNLRGDNVSLQINATQVDGDALTYDATNLPTGLSIDSQTGIISGTVDPSATLGTPSAVTVTATDEATNLTASQTFNWTIAATNVAPVLTSPGNQTNVAGDQVSLQLSASDADGDALTYTAVGLPSGLSVDPISGLVSGTLPNSAASSTPYNVTVTASDGQASSSQSFTWAVNVVSLQNPGDQSNLDGDAVSLQMSATDANNATLTYSAVGLPSGLSINSTTGLISGTVANSDDSSSPYSVTVTATDGTNSASQAFNWNVARLALTAPSDQQNQEGTAVSLQLSATDVPGTPTYSATGLPPGLSLNSTTGLITGTVGLGSFGSSPYQVTATATDGTNTSSQSFVWTVTPRVALVNPGPQSNASGDSVSIPVTATSPGGTMNYSATGLPTGLSINSTTGLITGTLANTDASATPYSITVTANDGTSSSNQTFAWTVSAINLLSPGDQTNNDGDAVSLSLTTSYHGTGTLNYSATGLPMGLNINGSTGQITGTIAGTADTNSPYSVTVTATDGTNTSSQTFTWTVNAVVSINSLNDQSNAVGDAVSVQVTASDALNNALTYSATNLPTGLTISSTTGLISGTIGVGADSGSPYATTVTATDSAGLSATQSFNWNVAHVALVNPGALQSLDGANVSLQLQGGDADGDTVSYTASGLPTGLSVNNTTGLISGTIASNADTNSPYSVTLTANDGVNTTTQTFLWTVSQVSLSAPSDQTNTEGDNVSLQLQGMASSGTLTYSASGLPSGLSLNATTGLITGTIVAGDAASGPYTVDVSASNGAVSTSQTFTWTVNPVVALSALADQNNNEGGVVSLQMTATDSLNNTLTYSAAGLPSGLSINSTTGLITGTVATGDSSGGPYAATVTASDGTYSSSVTFNWNVTHTDTTALTMNNPNTQTNVAGDSVNLQINASDPDGIDTLTYSATGLPDGLSIDPYLGTITGTVADDAVNATPYQATVTADDSNGQTVSQTFSWLVNAAALVAQASPISTVEGNDTGSITVATFTTPDMSSQASDFTAIVNWGDGNTDEGTVAGQNGSFTVTDDHTYAEMNSYPVSVTIIDGVTGANITVTTTAAVTDAPLTLTGGFQLGTVAGQSSNLTLATLTDGNPNAGEDYSATVNWGDGSPTTQATLAYGLDGVVSIGGSYAYMQKGTYTVTITVTDVDGATATTTDTIVAGDVYAGIESNLTVASFQDSNSSVQASQFTATIQWGDGTQSNGTVSGGNGTFSVQGTHTYSVDSIDQPGGVYAVSVTITDPSGNTLTSSSGVTVVRPAEAITADNVAGTPGVALNNVAVASFTEPDTSDTASEFSATINWGDGTPVDTTATIVGANGLFQVLGNHTYATAGMYPVTVDISQGWNLQKKSEITMSAALIDALGKTSFGSPLAIQQMQFNNGIDVWSDTTGKKFESPQWVAAGGQIGAPYAYVRGSSLDVKAEFKLVNFLDKGKGINIRATIIGQYLFQGEGDRQSFQTQLPEKLVNVDAKTGLYEYQATAVRAFPNWVTAYTPLRIYWTASLAPGGIGRAGITSDPIYLLYAKPNTTLKNLQTQKNYETIPYQTAVAYGSVVADGENNPSKILAGIWSNFDLKTAKEASPDGLLDGKPLTYYGTWAKNQGGVLIPASESTLSGLLQTTDGQCGAWAELLLDAILVQGLPLNNGGIGAVKLVRIFASLDLTNDRTKAATNVGLMVGPWGFVGAQKNNMNAASKANFPWINNINSVFVGPSPGVKLKPQEYDFAGKAVVPYLASAKAGAPLIAQNNSYPLAAFPNHELVQINGLYYDPSYGKTYASLDAMQGTAITGYYSFLGLRLNKMFIGQLTNVTNPKDRRLWQATRIG